MPFNITISVLQAKQNGDISSNQCLEQFKNDIEQYLSKDNLSISWRTRDTVISGFVYLLLIEGKLQDALDILNQSQDELSAILPTKFSMSASLYRSIIAYLSGDYTLSLEHFSHSITLYQKISIVQPFLYLQCHIEPIFDAYLQQNDEDDKDKDKELFESATHLYQSHFKQSLNFDDELVLSQREREILSTVASGLQNKHVAKRLGISGNTVRFHLKNIFIKLGVKSRTQAVSVARDKGLIH